MSSSDVLALQDELRQERRLRQRLQGEIRALTVELRRQEQAFADMTACFASQLAEHSKRLLELESGSPSPRRRRKTQPDQNAPPAAADKLSMAGDVDAGESSSSRGPPSSTSSTAAGAAAPAGSWASAADSEPSSSRRPLAPSLPETGASGEAAEAHVERRRLAPRGLPAESAAEGRGAELARPSAPSEPPDPVVAAPARQASDSDEALARRLQAEYDKEAAGARHRGVAPPSVAGRAGPSSGVGAAAAGASSRRHAFRGVLEFSPPRAQWVPGPRAAPLAMGPPFVFQPAQVPPIGDGSYEALLDLQERVGSASRGLSALQISQYPSRTIRPADLESVEEDRKRCPVCCEDYSVGATVRTLPCLHFYHSECIDRWLGDHRDCPICKRGLLDRLDVN
eukprot:tig00021133_g18916.t1